VTHSPRLRGNPKEWNFLHCSLDGSQNRFPSLTGSSLRSRRTNFEASPTLLPTGSPPDVAERLPVDFSRPVLCSQSPIGGTEPPPNSRYPPRPAGIASCPSGPPSPPTLLHHLRRSQYDRITVSPKSPSHVCGTDRHDYHFVPGQRAQELNRVSHGNPWRATTPLQTYPRVSGPIPPAATQSVNMRESPHINVAQLPGVPHQEKVRCTKPNLR
jgi:hypothetical protein